MPPHAFDSSAACADCTARFTSAFVALATVASTCPVDGSLTSNVAAIGRVDALTVDDESFSHDAYPRTALAASVRIVPG